MDKRAGRWVRAAGHSLEHPAAVMGVAAVLFAAIAAVRVAYPAPKDAIGILFVLPIAVVATQFGIRGGLAAALVALALQGAVSAVTGEFFGVVGYLVGAGGLLLLGAVVGGLSERLASARRAETNLLESSPSAIVEVDSAGRVLRANAEAQRLLDYPGDSLIGSPAERILPEHLRTNYEDFRESYFADPSIRSLAPFELSLLRRDGVEIPVVISLAPVRFTSGLRARMTIGDMSDRSKMQEALRETAHTLESIVDNTTAVIVLKDADGRYLLVNRQWQRLFGHSRDEVKGKTVHDVLPPELADQLAANDTETLETRSTTEVQEVVQLEDGPHTYLSVRFPLLGEDGTPYAVGTVSTDITTQKQVEEEVRRAQRALEESNADLDQFALVASHDLQEPLRTMAGFAQLLQRRHGEQLDAEGREFVGYIIESGSRMQHLIEDLLTYSREGRRALRMGLVDANVLAEDVIGSLGQAVDDAEADIVVGPLPTVEADARQLAQVLQNLVANAIKFRGPEPLRIEISAARRDDEWAFSVADNGIGIDPQHADRVFQAFQRLHTREQFDGTGMGLAICQRMVERHGGRIWCEPRPGGGTVFCFTLPMPEDAARHPAGAAATRESLT